MILLIMLIVVDVFTFVDAPVKVVRVVKYIEGVEVVDVI